MRKNSFLNAIKLLLELIIIYYILFNMKRIKYLRWLYYFTLIMFTLLFSIWPPSILYAIFGPSNALGNVLNLLWHFYTFVGITFLASFLIVDYLVNKGLKATGFQQMARFSPLNFTIGISLVLLLIYNATGGIEEMRKRDQHYRDSVDGKNLKFKS